MSLPPDGSAQPWQPAPAAQQPALPPPPRKPKVGLIVLLVVILVLVLAGAVTGTVLLVNALMGEAQSASEQGTSEPPSQQPSPSASPEDDETPAENTTPPAPAPIVLPDCATLNPPAQQATQHLLDLGAELIPPPGEAGVAEFNSVFGPVARETMTRATQMQGCYYVLSMHDAMHQFVAEITPEASAPLLGALRAEPLFTEGMIGEATTFISTYTEETSIGTMTETVAHAFLGDVWVSLYGTGDGVTALTPALDAVIATNPGLGGSTRP